MTLCRRARNLTGALLMATMASAGCASSTVRATPVPFPGTPRPAWSAPATIDPAITTGLLASALALRGTPYRFGGDQPATGFDCSGLVRYVFLGEHIELPRTVNDQFRVGVDVAARNIEPGDLIFFDTDIAAPGPSHVGIAVDRDTFVHAPGSGSVVRVDRLSAPYWAERLSGVRRVREHHP